MKHFILIFAFIFSVCGLQAQKVFFPSKTGTKLTYNMLDKKGKLTSKLIYTIKDISGSGSKMTVVYDTESYDAKDKLAFKDEIKVTLDGDKIYMDMSNFLNKAAFQQNGEIPASVEVTGNNMEIPVVPVPGTAMPDANVTMSLKMGFINMKTAVVLTNRKVEAIEDIAVPAGTFNSFKFSSDVNTTVLGIKANYTTKEWYAYGVGIIKSETYDKKGEIQSSMQLVELSR